jgi:ribosome biogenesis GTPase / thiamine phosphate phosphatase
VRADDSRGRHTTTSRDLYLLPAGACVIDTPGMRELQLRGDDANVAATFDDIEALAARCRFADCRHAGEPGCAVREAIDAGELSNARLTSYVKLLKEMAYQAARADNRAQAAFKARNRALSKWSKQFQKGNGKS